MSATEQDRERAAHAFSEWVTFRAGDGGLSIGRATDEERIAAIAAALADERDRARAPFLALAEEAERFADEETARYPGSTRVDGVAATRRVYARAIRRAAEEDQ